MLRSLYRRLKSGTAPMLSPIHAPILVGPLRGCCWSLGSRGKLARIFLGTYEPRVTSWFLENVSAGDSMFDVGANVGYYTVLAGRIVGDRGQVVAIEPASTNVHNLHNNVRLNQLTNVKIFPGAAGEKNATVRFHNGAGTGTGHISKEGGTEIPMRRLDDLATAYDVVPTMLKIDVEGAELNVLRGATRLLTDAKPNILLSTHGQAAHERCLRLLCHYGYAAVDVDMVDPRAGGEVLLKAA